MCSYSFADRPQHVFLVLFWFPPQANQTLLLSWRPLMAESMNSCHWVSTAFNRNEKVSPISAYLELKIFMDIDGFEKKKKLRGCFSCHPLLLCWRLCHATPARSALFSWNWHCTLGRGKDIKCMPLPALCNSKHVRRVTSFHFKRPPFLYHQHLTH